MKKRLSIREKKFSSWLRWAVRSGNSSTSWSPRGGTRTPPSKRASPSNPASVSIFSSRRHSGTSLQWEASRSVGGCPWPAGICLPVALWCSGTSADLDSEWDRTALLDSRGPPALWVGGPSRIRPPLKGPVGGSCCRPLCTGPFCPRPVSRHPPPLPSDPRTKV